MVYQDDMLVPMQALQVAKGHAKSMEDMRRASQVQMSQLATQHQTEPADEGTEEDLTQYHDELRESDARLQEATRQVSTFHSRSRESTI